MRVVGRGACGFWVICFHVVTAGLLIMSWWELGAAFMLSMTLWIQTFYLRAVVDVVVLSAVVDVAMETSAASKWLTRSAGGSQLWIVRCCRAPFLFRREVVGFSDYSASVLSRAGSGLFSGVDAGFFRVFKNLRIWGLVRFSGVLKAEYSEVLVKFSSEASLQHDCR